MKKVLLFLGAVFVCTGCYKDDVSVLYGRQHELEKRLEEIREIVDNTNRDIDLIWTIVNNSGDDDGIVSVNELADGSGYSILFRKSGEKIVRHGNTPYIGANGHWFVNSTDSGIKAAGSDGISPTIGTNGNWWVGSADTGVKAAGTAGASGESPVIGLARDSGNPSDENLYWTQKVGNGQPEFILVGGQKVKANGESGATPAIGVKQDTDGEYYWTVTTPPAAETWILVNGSKVRATGKDGAPGTPGIPGQDGAPGDSFFKSVDYSKADYVTFALNTTPEVTFSVPRYRTIAFAVDSDRLEFENFGVTKVIPFTLSNNVVAVQAGVPDGWRAQVDMSARTVSLTSPHIDNEFAELYGLLSLVAFDNKGMAASVTISVEVTQTIRLALKRGGGADIPATLLPDGMRVYYFPGTGTHYNGLLNYDLVPTEIVTTGVHNTGKQNRTQGWTIVSWANEPNVTWDDYNATRNAASVDLYDVEVSLKEHPGHAGYYMPLASNDRNFYWQKTAIAQGAALASPVVINHLHATAKVGFRINNAHLLADPDTGGPIDPAKLWIAFGGQGRACDFFEAEVSQRQRGSLPLVGEIAVESTNVYGTTVEYGYIGSFGSLGPINDPSRQVSVRVMYGNKMLAGRLYDTSASIAMGSVYFFNITATDSTTIEISVTVDGWTMKWGEVTLIP